jgi:CHAT domain-containing protein
LKKLLMIMRRLLHWMAIALLGLFLSLGLRHLPAIQASVDSPVLTSQTSSATSLVQQGKQAYDAGRFAEAADTLQQAAQTYQEMSDELGQAQALGLASLAYQKLGQWDAAETAIKTSLSLLTSAPPLLQAQVLNAQAHFQLATGNAEAALETWEIAERLYAQAEDTTGIWGSQINQIQALRSLGLSRRAEQQINAIEQNLLQLPDSSLKLTGLQSLGTIRRQSNQLQRSQELLTQAVQLAQRLELPELESQAQLNLGNTFRTLASRAEELGDDTENSSTAEAVRQAALMHYQQAAAIARSPVTRLQAQSNHLSLLVETFQWQVAQALWAEIEQLIPQLPASRATVYAQVNLATSWMQAANAPSLPRIEPALIRAIEQADALNDLRAKSHALGTLGQWQENQQRWTEAQTTTEQALQIAQTMNAADLLYQWQWQMGRILCGGVGSCSQSGDRQEAIAYYTQAIQVLNELRGDLVALNPDIQFSFRDRVEPVYRQFVDLLLQPTAVTIAEEPGISQANLQQARNVIEALQLAELDNFFRDACAKPVSINIDNLDPTAATIYPIILPDRLEVILKLPGSDQLRHASQSDLTDTQVNQAIAQLQSALKRRSTSPRQFRQTAKQLYDWLIQPFAADLDWNGDRAQSSVKTLVFVLDGALRNIPPAALSDGDRFLVERYAVAIAPSLQLVDPQPFSREPLHVLIAGTSNAPSFQQEGLAPIDYVETELAGIQQQIPQSAKLEGQAFLRDNIQTQLQTAPFNIVHIATHGQFSSNPDQTFILDWKQRIGIQDLESLLRVRDTSADRQSEIELLILSACETAAGDNRAALGLAGIAIRAGARSTIATLFQINDASTTEFMLRFYQQLTNSQLTKAEALRNTQLAFLQEYEVTDYNRPYHWAPFILVGNWL